MSIESTRSVESGVRRQLVIVSALLLLLIGPLFGPIAQVLGNRFEIESAVLLLLVGFIVGFGIILGVIFVNNEFGPATWRQGMRSLGLGQPSRLSANVVGVLVGLVWGALFLSSILQFAPETNVAAIDLFRVATALIAAFGTVLEDLITRGFVMNGLRQINAPGWMQLLGSALLFALYHTIWAFNPFSFIFSLLYGLILAGLFLWGKRSLTPVILAHAIPVLIAEPFSSMLIFLAPGA